MVREEHLERDFSPRLGFCVAAVLALFGLGASARAQDIQGLSPESALALARERYNDLLLLRRVEWGDARVKAIVSQVEYEAARLLSQQVRKEDDPVRGRFEGMPVRDLEGLKQAYAETTRALSLLSLAFVCKGCRFYNSGRVAEAMALGEEFLQRLRDTALSLTPFGLTPPRLQADPRRTLEWLWRCESALPANTTNAFRKVFSGIRSSRKAPIRLPCANPPFAAFLAALYFKDVPLALRARSEFIAQLNSSIGADGCLLGERQRLDILSAAALVHDAALFQYLTRGTVLAFDRETTLKVCRSLVEFVSRAAWAGRPDALACGLPTGVVVEDRGRAFTGDVWSASILLLSCGPPRPELSAALQGLRAGLGPALEAPSDGQIWARLAYGPLERGLPASSLTKGEGSGTTFWPRAGFALCSQRDFYASIRLPFPESASEIPPGDARLFGAMNLLTQEHNPAPLFLGAGPRWAWPSCTTCEALRTKTGLVPGVYLRETEVLGAAVLSGSLVAAASIVAKNPDLSMRANRSWFVFEDKIVALGTCIEAATTGLSNPGWAAAERDRFPWLAIEFPAPTLINRIRLYYRVENGVYTCVPREIIFQVSMDGQNWRDVRSVTQMPASGSAPSGYVLVKIPPVQVRHLRLFFPEGADGPGVRLSDVQVFYVERKEDEKLLGREIPNLASARRGARASASSFTDEANSPGQVLLGLGEPRKASVPVATCVLVLPPKGGPLVAYDGEMRRVGLPAKDKQTRLSQVRWLNANSVGCLFLKPADLIIKNERDEECDVWLDHANADSFGLIYMPNQTWEETGRTEAAAVMEVTLERKGHRVTDRGSGLSAFAFFGPCEKGDVVTPGKGCLMYAVDGQRLACSLTRGLLQEGVGVRAAGVQEVWIDGRPGRWTYQNDYVVIKGGQ